MEDLIRYPIIAGNWKMYKSPEEAADFVRELNPLIEGLSGVEVVIAPPFTDLEAVKREIGGTSLQLAAQNVHQERHGAYTGEVSAVMLAEAGCRYVICGHSERRAYFREDDDTIGAKLRMVVSAGMTPILCIGETLEERDEAKTFEVLGRQISVALGGFTSSGVGQIVIAYEPLWAIGTGKTATPDIAQEAHAFIRSTICEIFDDEASESVRILYGGSVKPDNIARLMTENDIDGALVGGASLEPESFAEILRYREHTK